MKDDSSRNGKRSSRRLVIPSRRELVRSSVATQRFGSVAAPPEPSAETAPDPVATAHPRRARLRALYRIVPTQPGAAHAAEMPVIARGRAVARAMRPPTNPIALEPATSIKRTEVDLVPVPARLAPRDVPTLSVPRPPLPSRAALLGGAIVLATLIVALASLVRRLVW